MTTLVVYPDTGSGKTTVDGYAEVAGANATWGDIRAAAGTASGDTDSNARCCWVTASTTSNQFARNRRSVFTFDTATVPAAAVISAVTCSLYGTAKNNGLGNPALHVVNSAPAANNDVANGDYGNVGTTDYGNVSYASYSTTGYNDISLDTAAVTKAGITKLGARLSWDFSDTFGGTWSSGATSNFYINWSDNGSSQPKLTVVYTVPVPRSFAVMV